jgi:hypothetical protein
MSPAPIGIFAVAGAGVAGSYDLLATTILTTTTASVTFSSLNTLAAGYQHLQIRMVSRQALAAGGHGQVYVRFNGDGAGNYSHHALLGNGSSVSSFASANATFALGGLSPYNNEAANAFMPSVIDILDPFETTKNTTIRALSGAPTSGNNTIQLSSGAHRNTAAVTSITIAVFNQFITGSRFSLYGLKVA